MASNNPIEGWADRMVAHLQSMNIKMTAAEIERATQNPTPQAVVNRQIIDFLERYEKQQIKEHHMAEIKTAGNNYNL